MNGQDDNPKAPASRSTGDFTGEALADNHARFAVPPPPGVVSGTLGSCHGIHEPKRRYWSGTQFAAAAPLVSTAMLIPPGFSSNSQVAAARSAPAFLQPHSCRRHALRVDNEQYAPCPCGPTPAIGPADAKRERAAERCRPDQRLLTNPVRTVGLAAASWRSTGHWPQASFMLPVPELSLPNDRSNSQAWPKAALSSATTPALHHAHEHPEGSALRPANSSTGSRDN
jgi:hypothetical protein